MAFKLYVQYFSPFIAIATTVVGITIIIQVDYPITKVVSLIPTLTPL
jgi:hypothetical protein